MSGYQYAFNVTPARPTGWRSFLTGFVTIMTVVAVSTVSGAMVTLELIAPRPPHANAPPAVAATPIQIPAATQRAVQVVTPSVAAVAQDQKHVQDLRVAAPTPALFAPSIAATPAVAAAPPAVPAASAVPVEAQAARNVPDSELTFARGYALRRAAQEAAEEAASAAAPKVATVGQLGRAAVVRRVASTRPPLALDPRRVTTARGEGAFDRPERFDSRRREALAYGEQRQPRRPAGGPQGFFTNLFGGNNNSSLF